MMSKDYLKFTDYLIDQDDEYLKVNSDTVILGMSMDSLKNKTLLDIGTNTGALLLYGLKKGASKLIGVDIQEGPLRIAKGNLERYHANFELIRDDIKNIDNIKADVIVCNPPYFEMNNVTPDEKFKTAMFEESLRLDDLFHSYRRLLKDNGEIYMIYPADRYHELYDMCLKYKLKIMKMRFVHDTNKEYALRVVLKMKIGKMTKVRIYRPIMIDKGDFKWEA